MSLKGKKIVITGGSSGIGLATARALANWEAEVIIAGRTVPKLEQAKQSLGPRAAAAPLDVTREPDVKRAFENIGPFDHLITAASGVAMGAFREIDTAAARELFESKFWGQYLCAKHAAGRLRPGGSIVLFSGIASRKPMAGLSTYAAIDGAIESLARTLALELAPIRVNVVTPGVIETPAWDGMPEPVRRAQLDAIAASLPVKRVGTPDDVAKTVLYLLDNEFMTGAIVDVDGGHRVI
ncbi:MAG: SDR family oxidoreductase [Nitrospirota bacterium]